MIHTNLKKTWDNFIAHTLFQVSPKAYLSIWKTTRTSFLLRHFFKYLKKHTYESEKPGTIFFLIPFSKYLKKHPCQSEKYLKQFLCSYPFSNIEKSILTNLKILGTIFLLILFFKYIKKQTYQSENTWDNFLAHTLLQIFKNSYIQIWAISRTISLPIPFLKC